MNRREFSAHALKTAVAVFFVKTLMGCSNADEITLPETGRIVAPKAVYEINRWALDLNQYCKDLKLGGIGLTDWQDRLDELFGRIDLKDLVRFIDFEKLKAKLELPDFGVSTLPVKFPSVNGMPATTVFVKKIFGMQANRSIIPHGHSNMASGHLILEGDLRLRQYNKISQDGESLTIKKTVDKEIGSGDFSSISDERNNVHWFVAGDQPAYTFDVIMLDIAGRKYDIHNLDIDSAVETGGGELRVPMMKVKMALSKYGKVHDV